MNSGSPREWALLPRAAEVAPHMGRREVPNQNASADFGYQPEPQFKLILTQPWVRVKQH